MTEHPESLRLARLAAQAAADKKARDILIIDVHPTLTIVDYFVLVSADNGWQLEAICAAVEDRLSQKARLKPLGCEGRQKLEWVLLDFGDIVVHVFLPTVRETYRLESLFNDSTIIPFPLDDQG